MPSLLQLNCTSNWGSTGKIAEQIGLKAKAAGWDSYIAYGRSSNPSQLQVIKVGNELSVLWHYAENRLFDNEGLASRAATQKLIKIIKTIKPDVIQFHNIHDHWLNYHSLFNYLNTTDIPVCWTFHDCWTFTGHCYHFVNAQCDKWKSECHHCPLNKSLIDRSQRNFLLKKRLFAENKNLHIITVSEWLKDLVQQSFLKGKNIYVLNNGIDLKVFRPLSKEKKEKYQIIGVSSVWHRTKGLYDFYTLRKMLPRNEYSITLVGLTSKQIAELPQGITGIARTNSVQELVEIYSSANVLVNPTYADSFPTVNIEALACGTPVITYQTGGSPEIIDEQTGFVISQGDVNALVTAIQNLKRQPISSEICRKRAEEHFDQAKCFEAYLELYHKLITK